MERRRDRRGGITGTFAASQGVPVWLHMLVVGLIGLGVTVFGGWLARMPQREPLREDHHESMSLKAVAWKLVLPLALIAMAGSLVEDVGNNWAALYLNQFGGGLPRRGRRRLRDHGGQPVRRTLAR